MPYRENWYEFSERQNVASIRDNQNRHWFENGAVWIARDSVEGEGHDPPEDEMKCAHCRRNFHRLWLADAERKFQNLQGTLAAQVEISQAGAGPVPDPQDIAFLKKLAADIKRYRRTLAKIDQQLAPVRTPRRLNIREQQAEAAARAKQELANIHI